MYFFDSHAHVHLARFADPQLRRIRLREAHRAGVRAIVTSAVGPADWKDALALSARSKSARRAPLVRSTLGLHPYALLADPRRNDEQLSALESALAEGPDIVALGECGLDFRDPQRSPVRAPREEQVRVCKRQLELAVKFELPVVLHCVKAHAPLLELLQAFDLRPSVMHAYSGSGDHALRLIQRGHFISFASTLLLNDAKRTHAAVQALPAAHLLIETDSPDQCPAHREPPNRPSYIVDIARGVATLRNRSVQEIAALTLDNACRVYDVQVSL